MFHLYWQISSRGTLGKSTRLRQVDSARNRQHWRRFTASRCSTEQLLKSLRFSHTTADLKHNFYSSKISKCNLTEQPKTFISPPLRTNFAGLCLEIIDRRVDLIEAKQGHSLHADETPYETTTDYKDMIDSTGNRTATVDTSGLFDDIGKSRSRIIRITICLCSITIIRT